MYFHFDFFAMLPFMLSDTGVSQTFVKSGEGEVELEAHLNSLLGIPGWRSGLAPAFGLGCDPGDRGSNPTSGSRCMEPASPSACVSASLSLYVTIINK